MNWSHHDFKPPYDPERRTIGDLLMEAWMRVLFYAGKVPYDVWALIGAITTGVLVFSWIVWGFGIALQLGLTGTWVALFWLGGILVIATSMAGVMIWLQERAIDRATGRKK